MAENQEIKCGECPMRAKYDSKPKSFGGRFWRWHINWCPGWKAYMNSLDETQKQEIAKQYHLKKYLNN
jgi:hypothetical protein